MNDDIPLRNKGRHLTDIEVAKVLGLVKAGKSQREIAHLMHCTQKPVQNALANYDFETFHGRDNERTYKRKTTKREDRYIERVIKQNHDVPLKDITNKLDVNISQTTLR